MTAPQHTSVSGARPPGETSQDTRLRERQGRSARAVDLFERRLASSDEAERRALLEEIIELYVDVAGAIARRYRGRGIDDDDLEQVAHVGLFHAARRFDVRAGSDFLSYAVPTIRGEVRRHFRDHGWTVRPPRRVQELQQRLPEAQNVLERRLGRSPRPTELAEHLGVSTDDVIETVSARGCYSPTSLDELATTEDASSMYELLGVHDAERGAVEARVVLGPLVRDLSERDRRILSMRFFDGCTQSEIAADIGVTQMQVSRLLTRILRELREKIVL